MPSAKKKSFQKYFKKEFRKELQQYLYIAASVFLLILSLLNLQKYTSIPKVLGVQVEYDMNEVLDSKKYWEELVSKNPTYYDGWQQLYEINLLLGNYEEASYAKSVAKRIDFNR